MKHLFTLALLLFCLHMQASVTLRHQGTATQLVVNGKPMLLLAGELSNSAATSIADIDSVMPRMHRLGLNAVFVPAYWDLTEPEEGRFDFSLVDEVIRTARANDLKVIFLWFGVWKNSMSCYAPLWFKQDTKRFPRSMTSTGKPLEIATAFSEEVMKADRKAFCELMRHIKSVDATENTVVMVQVENEIGMLEAARDHSPLAEKAWRAAVPADVAKVLGVQNGKNGWAKAVGTDLYAEEKFQAYHYACYVEQIASAGKAVYNLPMYVNAAMNSRGRKPGEYPSAGPLAHLIKIWKCAAPSIDIYAPDIYDLNYKGWVAQYKLPDNPFFTPEVRLGDYSGVRAFYTFGEVDAMSYSPFAIDQAPIETTAHVSKAYNLLHQLTPLILQKQGADRQKPTMWGLLFDQKDQERLISDGNTVLTCRHYFTLPWDPRATNGQPWPEGGALIIKLAEHEYLIAGSGIVVTFQTAEEIQQEQKVVRGEDGFVQQGNVQEAKTDGNSDRKMNSASPMAAKRFSGKRLGIGYVDHVAVDEQDKLRFLRRDNGDQDHQGRHARIACGDYALLHVKLYEY